MLNRFAARSIDAKTTRADARDEPERERCRQILEGERRGAVHGQERCGAVDGDKREVAACRCDERRAEHVAGEVVLVRDFERKHRAGRRCLEDGGDAGRGARDEEQPALLR